MGRRRAQGEVDEGPSAEDVERFGGVTHACPSCGTEVYDDVDLCWKCGASMRRRSGGPPGWVLVTALMLVVVIVLVWVL